MKPSKGQKTGPDNLKIEIVITYAFVKVAGIGNPETLCQSGIKEE
jgi:hypothetical protein